ncbi:MAG: MFS transporter [Thermoguttaceae bacterium]
MRRWLFPKLDLTGDVRRTFRFHLAYALLDAVCGGVLLNVPFVALREIGGQNWQLPLRDGCAGVGMLASLYLGGWMASRRKMPFVFVPGLLAGCCSLAMVVALAAGDAFWFQMLFGLGSIFELITRPAIAAILRQNYPVAHRARITASVRQWASLAFAVSLMASACGLSLAGGHARMVAGAELVGGASLGLAAFVCFRRIRPHEESVAAVRHAFRLEIFKNFHNAVEIVTHDARYRRHLLGCLIENFFNLLGLSLLAALLSKTLGYGYLGCAMLMHGLPTLAAFATTGFLGRWFDRESPWISWAAMRLAFGLDAWLLAAAATVAGWLPPIVLPLLMAGRLLRGGAQGGWWILWWQIGITHFAPPGENTSRYAAIMTFLYGLTRLAASLVGIGLAVWNVAPSTLLWIGGAGVMFSGVYSLVQSRREQRQHGPRTFAEFEARFN